MGSLHARDSRFIAVKCQALNSSNLPIDTICIACTRVEFSTLQTYEICSQFYSFTSARKIIQEKSSVPVIIAGHQIKD